MTLLLYIHEPLIHCFAIILDTATWILCAQLLHVFTPLLYRLTGLHAFIVYLFLLHGTWFMLFLRGYSCIPVTRLYSSTDIDFSLLDTLAVDMPCVELSTTWI